MLRYPEDALRAELALLGCHLHWSLDDLLDLPHRERVRLVDTVMSIERARGRTGNG